MSYFSINGISFNGRPIAPMRRNLDPIFVGQAPGAPKGPRPHEHGPLAGPCGDRLASLLEISWDEFIKKFYRVNLLQEWPGKSGRGDEFPRSRGIIAAAEFVARGLAERRSVVLLGREVARCFRVEADYLETVAIDRPGSEPGTGAGAGFLLPHPSGVNRWWNEKRNVQRAKSSLQKFLQAYL